MPFLSTPSFDLSAGAEPTLGPRPPPPPPPTPPSQPQVSEAAARRLREAEERLREAIQELHQSHGRDEEAAKGGGWGCCVHQGESCAAHAAGNLCQTFLLSYGVRVGIGILLRAFKLARRRSYASLLDLKVPKNLTNSFFFCDFFFFISNLQYMLGLVRIRCYNVCGYVTAR